MAASVTVFTRPYPPVRLAPQLIGPDGAAYAFLVLPNQIKLRGGAATSFGLALFPSRQISPSGSTTPGSSRAGGRPPSCSPAAGA